EVPGPGRSWPEGVRLDHVVALLRPGQERAAVPVYDPQPAVGQDLQEAGKELAARQQLERALLRGQDLDAIDPPQLFSPGAAEGGARRAEPDERGRLRPRVEHRG